jgi:hypothetical protein
VLDEHGTGDGSALALVPVEDEAGHFAGHLAGLFRR